MKNLVLLVVVVFASTVFAEDAKVVRTWKVQDSKWGDLEIKVTDMSEPVYQPFRVTVTAECKDQKTGQKIINNSNNKVLTVQVCEFEGYSVIEENKESSLLLYYKVIDENPSSGHYQAECKERVSDKISFQWACSPQKR